MKRDKVRRLISEGNIDVRVGRTQEAGKEGARKVCDPVQVQEM